MKNTSENFEAEFKKPGPIIIYVVGKLLAEYKKKYGRKKNVTVLRLKVNVVN